MKTDESCIFCKIVAREAPAAIVCEDERTLAFMDLFPVSPGHTLIIPKEHGANIFESSADDLAAVARTAKRVAEAIKACIAPDGLGVFQLKGAAAGQTVFHYHTHLIPRNEGEPLALHSRVQGDEEELEATARKIAAVLEG